ncbi:Multidrug efflux pump subunit AcrA (membrane-fusion protein) [Granulicatella balaenopterae]|uniref:Multidrug efflux pump subunit AcrA (Membrane-fusion protein) n=1 Tax=Granulicatella balaenopterae TaxID=137733 RepID=A0A1H9KM29_9LACT|nr:efflux RND transporter periplasmic adaptor subunit [Granulicatella balaenopterae]SER00204.1 Multidrug efflux pump subunit AcrA (membrane-fusion protein) [Granulicatella balaenopterae]
MSKKAKVSIFSLCGLGLIAIIFAVFSLKKQLSNTEELATSFPAYLVKEQEPLVLDGVVITKDEESYYVDPTKGEVEEVYVKDGQTVAAGDKLFSYHNDQATQEISDLNRQKNRLYGQMDDLKQQLNKQETAKQTAKAEAEKAKQQAQAVKTTEDSSEPMQDTKQPSTDTNVELPAFDPSVFDEQIDATKKAIKELNQSIEDMDININRTSEKTSAMVTAMIDGVISINQKGKTNPTEVFMKLLGSSNLIQTAVTEYDYYAVTEGLETDIYVNAEDRDVKGTITSVAKEPLQGAGMAGGTMGQASSDLSKYQVLVKPETSLPLGFNVQVKVPLKGLVIPETAIITEEDGEYVYKVEQDTAIKTKITRQKEGLQLIVTEGVALGDIILSQPDDTVTDGQSVVTEIINEDVE